MRRVLGFKNMVKILTLLPLSHVKQKICTIKCTLPIFIWIKLILLQTILFIESDSLKLTDVFGVVVERLSHIT
jgi:hypothetical protein